jgi:hypothetical protein
MYRKFTAWKKNRKLGDVAGGRKWPKIEDRLFRREHCLKPPSPGQPIPILIEENPSKDFFFPITGKEALEQLRSYPEADTNGITHLWLRRLKTASSLIAKRPLAEYIYGSRVCVIVVYPWAKDRLLRLGHSRPATRVLRHYSRWTSELVHEGGQWCLRWPDEKLREFYLSALIGHEVGHHQDEHQWTRANEQEREECAEQYSLRWMADGEKVILGMDEV